MKTIKYYKAKKCIIDKFLIAKNVKKSNKMAREFL